jgi:hypothetical protein
MILLPEKILSTVILATMIFSLLAVNIGEPFYDEFEESPDIIDLEKEIDYFREPAGTRADSLNVDLMGRVPFGYVIDTWVEGNYAYVGIENAFMILDISDKSNPLIVGTFDTDEFVMGVQVVGNIAYLANSYNGLRIVNVADPANPQLVATQGVTMAAVDLFVDGSFAYIVDGSEITVIDVSTPSSPNPKDSFFIMGANSVYVSYPFAYVTVEELGPIQPGLWIINVTDPDSLTEEGRNETVTLASDVTVSGNYAYVANGSDLRIFNISDPTEPVEAGMSDTQAMSVDLKDTQLYLANGADGFSVIDVSDPESLSEIGTYTDYASHKIHIFDTFIYSAGHEQGLHIVDVSAPANPAEIGSYQASGIPRGVFYSDSMVSIAATGDLWTPSTGLWIVDATMPSDPKKKGNYDSPGDTRAVFAEGNLAYLADSDFGLRVVNIANPQNPMEMGSFVTSNAQDVVVVDSIAYVADAIDGLVTIDVSNPSAPSLKGSFPNFGGWNVFISDSFAYMAAGPNGLRIINITDPANPQEIGSFGTIEVRDVAVRGKYAYVIGADEGLTVLDVETPSNPTSLGNLNTFTDLRGIFVSWRYVYIADDEDGFRVIDVAIPANPQEIGYYVNSGGAQGVYVEDQYAYIVGDYGLFIFDVISTLDTTPPQYVSTNPVADELNVNMDIEIEITFNEAMDPTSTEQAFSITPAVDGNFNWMGNKLIFTPSSLLASGIPYEIEIASTARDLAGNTLDGDKNGIEDGSPVDDYSWQFTTMAETPKVVSHFPSQDAVRIFTDNSVIFNFSKAMNSHLTQEALSYEVDSVSTPAVLGGDISWTGGDTTMTFTPFGNFDNNKTYEFTLSHTAPDANGILFDGDGDGIGGEEGEDDFKLTFTTIPLPPKVQTFSPRNLETLVEVDTIISVKFSKHMDKASVEDAFSFTHAGTNTTWYATNGNVSWPSFFKMEFEPSFDLVYEIVYTVRIEATAKDAAGITLDGNKNKKPEDIETDSVEWSFTTITEPPKIISVEPVEGAQNVKLKAEIVINFDRSMDTRSTEDAFSYTYQGSLEDFDSSSGLITWTNNDRTMTFTPDIEYEEGETFTVTIDSSAEDTEGIEFVGYSWPFSTKINSEPVLEGGGVHPEKGDSSVTFTFSIIYTDDDDDPPVEILVVIDEVDWRMYESDPTGSFIDGKAYEYSIDLDSGTHKYYFSVENEKHNIRYPEGDVTRTLKVTEVEKELVFGVFEEEYAGMPTMACMPLGIVILVIIIAAVVISTKKRRARTQAASFQSFEPQAPTMDFLPEDSGEFMSFEPELEDDLMSFQTFEDEIPPETAQPVMIQCPECGEHLKVRSSVRPFQFPCKCGAKLVLR